MVVSALGSIALADICDNYEMYRVCGIGHCTWLAAFISRETHVSQCLHSVFERRVLHGIDLPVELIVQTKVAAPDYWLWWQVMPASGNGVSLLAGCVGSVCFTVGISMATSRMLWIPLIGQNGSRWKWTRTRNSCWTSENEQLRKQLQDIHRYEETCFGQRESDMKNWMYLFGWCMFGHCPFFRSW